MDEDLECVALALDRPALGGTCFDVDDLEVTGFGDPLDFAGLGASEADELGDIEELDGDDGLEEDDSDDVGARKEKITSDDYVIAFVT